MHIWSATITNFCTELHGWNAESSDRQFQQLTSGMWHCMLIILQRPSALVSYRVQKLHGLLSMAAPVNVSEQRTVCFCFLWRDSVLSFFLQPVTLAYAAHWNSEDCISILFSTIRFLTILPLLILILYSPCILHLQAYVATVQSYKSH
jgi:hypothetical protein